MKTAKTLPIYSKTMENIKLMIDFTILYGISNIRFKIVNLLFAVLNSIKVIYSIFKNVPLKNVIRVLKFI